MNLEKIGLFIKQKRKEQNLTQECLANKLNITEKAVSRWETGRGTPDISLLIPLSNILNITVLELLNGEEIKDENKAIVNLIKENNKKIKLWKYLSIFIINIILLLFLLLAIYGYLIPKKYESNHKQGITTILSASMSPTLKVNDAIIYDKLSINNVKKNDLIVFYYLDNIKTIHRVVDIIDNNNEISIITKGDNNLEVDNKYVTINNFLGIYNHKTSYLTSIFLKHNIKISTITFIFVLLGIISINYLDILLIIKNR